ncbi:hypothetical protein [Lysobacter enzymogenes]|uniref:hypothetical protein n=1 Tax=Lysobacter enzymogenes TaxID=69 RepID=UPI001A966CE7|nr:hypothetical protein [Lysobacter enzymogenes]QQP96678.1 hypothetical protein JHW38_01060 [Lysobacter enzymogenes]
MRASREGLRATRKAPLEIVQAPIREAFCRARKPLRLARDAFRLARKLCGVGVEPSWCEGRGKRLARELLGFAAELQKYADS